jgi:hypothetical protein
MYSMCQEKKLKPTQKSGNIKKTNLEIEKFSNCKDGFQKKKKITKMLIEYDL